MFEGVPPGSPLAQALFETYQGQINRFYLGQAQNERNGVADYTKKGQVDGPLTMQYANLQGQEIVRVKVAAGEMAKFEPNPKGWEPWDWLLVDMRTLLYGHTYSANSQEEPPGSTAYAGARWAARIVFPNLSDFPRDVGDMDVADDPPGIATELSSSGEDPPTLQLADAPEIYAPPLEAATIEVPTTHDLSSLLVDIRKYRTLEIIEVELYAKMDGLEADNGPTQLTGSTPQGFLYRYHNPWEGAEIIELAYRFGYNTELVSVHPNAAGAIQRDVSGITGEWPTQVNWQFDRYYNGGRAPKPNNNGIARQSTILMNYDDGWDVGVFGGINKYAPETIATRYNAGGDVTATFFGPGIFRSIRVEDTWGSLFANGLLGLPGIYPTPPPGGNDSYVAFGFDINMLFLPLYGNPPIDIFPASTADIYAWAFRGTPEWRRGYQELPAVDDNRYWWFFDEAAPNRGPAGPIAQGVPVDVHGPEPGEKNINNLVYVGKVVFEQRTGGFSFTRA